MVGAASRFGLLLPGRIPEDTLKLKDDAHEACTDCSKRLSGASYLSDRPVQGQRHYSQDRTRVPRHVPLALILLIEVPYKGCYCLTLAVQTAVSSPHGARKRPDLE